MRARPRPSVVASAAKPAPVPTPTPTFNPNESVTLTRQQLEDLVQKRIAEARPAQTDPDFAHYAELLQQQQQCKDSILRVEEQIRQLIDERDSLNTKHAQLVKQAQEMLDAKLRSVPAV